MKKAIAMRCTQEQFNSIKNKLKKAGCKIVDLDKFSEFVYLTNKFGEEQNTISNLHSSQDKLRTRWEIHETFNAKIFLDACGIDCDVYEITKEQVQYLYQLCNSDSRDYLHKKFPDAFKKELEVGKWYKGQNSIFCLTKIEGSLGYAYGIDECKWKDECAFEMCLTKKDVEATPQEIESALICEAKKREYEENVSIVSMVFNEDVVLKKHEYKSCDGDFCLKKGSLYWNGFLIFKGGKWATIIQPEKMTLEQIEKELGRKIQII